MAALRTLMALAPLCLCAQPTSGHSRDEEQRAMYTTTPLMAGIAKTVRCILGRPRVTSPISPSSDLRMFEWVDGHTAEPRGLAARKRWLRDMFGNSHDLLLLGTMDMDTHGDPEVDLVPRTIDFITSARLEVFCLQNTSREAVVRILKELSRCGRQFHAVIHNNDGDVRVATLYDRSRVEAVRGIRSDYHNWRAYREISSTDTARLRELRLLDYMPSPGQHLILTLRLLDGGRTFVVANASIPRFSTPVREHSARGRGDHPYNSQALLYSLVEARALHHDLLLRVRGDAEKRAPCIVAGSFGFTVEELARDYSRPRTFARLFYEESIAMLTAGDTIMDKGSGVCETKRRMRFVLPVPRSARPEEKRMYAAHRSFCSNVAFTEDTSLELVTYPNLRSPAAPRPDHRFCIPVGVGLNFDENALR